MALSSSICDCLCLFSPSLSHSPSHPELPTHQHLLCWVLRLKLISCRNVNAVNVLPPLLPFNFYMTTHCPPTSRQSRAPTSRAALTCLQHEIRLAHGPEFGAHRVLYGPDDCLLRGGSVDSACRGAGLHWDCLVTRPVPVPVPVPGLGQGCDNVSASGEHEFAFQHAT